MKHDDGNRTCRYCHAFIRGRENIHPWCRLLELKGRKA